MLARTAEKPFLAAKTHSPQPRRSTDQRYNTHYQQPLELVVFQFELAQSLALSGIHAAARGVPFVKAGVAKTVFAPDLLDRHTDLGLTKKANDLLFAAIAWFACPSFS